MARDDRELMQCWVNLIHAGTHLRKGLEQRLRDELGIGLSEQDLIKQLHSNGGTLLLSELGRRIYFSKAGVTRMLDRLEALGLVERCPVEGDRRSLSAVLTAEGEALFARSRKVLRSYVDEALGTVMETDRIAELGGLLEELLRGHGVWEGQQAHLKGGAA